MLAIATWTLLVATMVALVIYGLGLFSVTKHLRIAAKPPPSAPLPPVSLLKPVKGLEEELEENLRSFFEQTYPSPMELVFASSEADDPALALARRLSRDYPGVEARFVVTDPSFGLNPKVANLAGALAAAKYDLVLQSDANVRVGADYLERIVKQLLAEDASLLTSLVVGVGERSVGAAMENLQLTAFIAPGMCAALHVAHVDCVLGKAMLMRKSELNEVGGIECVRDILCEDFILGQRFRAHGKRIVLSTATVANINRDGSIVRFLARHSRWLKMRAVIHVGSFIADVFANPIALATVALVTGGFEPWLAVLWIAVIVIKLLGDSYLLARLRGEGMTLGLLCCGVLKDLLMGGVWVYSAFSRSVVWRGVKLRFGKDSRLRPDDGTLPRRVARRLVGRTS